MGNLSPWRTVPAVVRGKVRMPSESQPYADGKQPDQDRLPVADRLDDDHFPAYTMGRAAELVGVTPAFLRALGEARLITPTRSDGDTAATRVTSCGSPPAPASWSTRAPRWTPRAAS